ncbi:hypothetical protein WN48_03819 [Eufriesea mexicana]|uniref:Uncharacterized protein n=1 Tax=Eufriesea mexicana TaxID=516756 RepID=A0A310SAW6_9HYME|nr:hypothetical protein WN48_03819 [Eufriesea mexicana]
MSSNDGIEMGRTFLEIVESKLFDEEDSIGRRLIQGNKRLVFKVQLFSAQHSCLQDESGQRQDRFVHSGLKRYLRGLSAFLEIHRVLRERLADSTVWYQKKYVHGRRKRGRGYDLFAIGFARVVERVLNFGGAAEESERSVELSKKKSNGRLAYVVLILESNVALGPAASTVPIVHRRRSLIGVAGKLIPRANE